VKNNKEDSIALANHAREMTSKLVQTLQTRSDLDSLKPGIEDFFMCVYFPLKMKPDVMCVIEL
jgi:hypothetical protein